MADVIVFVDVETTVPSRSGQGFSLLEFGAILVCPRKLVELDSFSTLIRPANLSSVSATSVRCNGITRDAVAAAPTFCEVADKVYDILHGRVWAGHNIVRFDCLRIREAFAEIGRPAPEPKGTIDSLPLLTQRFGRRAGNMKMATLATYFGLGEQKHRSLDDVRMNLEVLKYCATVLFLESSLPDILTMNGGFSPNAATRSCGNRNTLPEGSCSNQNSPSDLGLGNCLRVSSPISNSLGDVLCLNKSDAPASKADPFALMPLIDLMKIDPSQPDVPVDERPVPCPPDAFSSGAAVSECCSGYAGFLDPDDVLLPSISASLVPAYGGSSRLVLQHKNVLLQLCCMKLKVRFGINAKFLDHAGRPRLRIVVDTFPSLCRVLDTCDHLAQKLLVESGSSSEWRPVVFRKNSLSSSSTIRLNIPTVANGDTATYTTQIYQKEPSGNTQKLVFNSIDAAELDSLFIPGALVDAFFSLDTYDYQQHAGIRLVAKKLIVYSE
ncbi:protein NEN1-like [Magnolia sinica]|uniref:protein NEN1-like n=1 Tax=Magnolia sinica TaxID=86752 RepID=UPI00265A1544|nr:protein NEN1-like [Magnolia sinica]